MQPSIGLVALLLSWCAATVLFPLTPSSAQTDSSSSYTADVSSAQASTVVVSSADTSAGSISSSTGVNSVANSTNSTNSTNGASSIVSVQFTCMQQVLLETEARHENGFNATSANGTVCQGGQLASAFANSSFDAQCPICGLPTNSAEAVSGTNLIGPPFRRNVIAPICIAVAGNGFANKTVFYPFVDTMALLQVKDSFKQTWLDLSASSRIRVEVAGVVSEVRSRFSGDCQTIVPFWTVLVTLDQGNVVSVDWDDGCSLCALQQCVNQTCGISLSMCEGYVSSTDSSSTTVVESNSDSSSSSSTDSLNVSGTNSTNCDLKIYLAWDGTDRDGNYLTSSAKRLSQFRRWSVIGTYNQVANFDQENVPTLDQFTNQESDDFNNAGASQ